MSRAGAGMTAATPPPSSPRMSESNLSELDGTAPSVVETSGGDYGFVSGWDGGASVDAKTLNLVSWKLDVNARAEDGIEKRGFNAISTVLNHPTKKANPLRASRKPLPPIAPPPALPRPPPPSAYDAYLQAVTPLYDTFLSAQASSSRSTTPLTGTYDGRPPESSGSGSGADLPPLDDIPEAFFSPDFDLSSPSTWASITGGSAGKNEPPERVVDSLSTHLDSLERHLIHEITLRSTSFFSALSNLQDLHSESASCLDRISELQGSLREIGDQQARKGLQVIDAQEKLKSVRLIETGVKEIGDLEELVKATRTLVDHGDWAAGLTCLADVVRWWDRHGLDGDGASGRAALPLATMRALASLPEALDQLSNAVANQLESSIAALLLATLSEGDVAPSADGAGEVDLSAFRRSAAPMLGGLAQCGQLGGVEGVLRDAVVMAVREGSRKHLPVATDDDVAGPGMEDGRGAVEMRGANLASALKQMNHRRYLLLSAQMFGTMLSRLKLARALGSELNDMLVEAATKPHLKLGSFVPTGATSPPATAPGTANPLGGAAPQLDVPDIVASACELANLRASKILAVRSEQHAGLQLPEFVEIFKENWDFVVETESLAKRMIVSLRGVTASQGRTFLMAYHSLRLTRSAKLVEEEQWAQIEVSPQVQHVVNVLIESAVKDPLESFVPSRAEPNGDAASAGEAGKTLDIENKSFFVVKATAESLVLLGDYLKVVVNLELVVTDVMARIIEFLKSFNSRTCQVVLGAGAMRSAGLKNITAKHLALASQSLSIIVALIPYIREFVRRHLSPKQAVMLTEFDKLKRDYQEHQNEIHAKLVAIMSDRLSVHIGSLREIDWEETPEKDAPRAYAEMLVKETATLHKVLSKYLSQQTVETVMSEVLAAIHHRLSEEYAKIELKSEDAKKRMLQDANLLATKLASLAEAGKVVASLETLVKDKPLPRKPMGEAVKGLWKRGGAPAGTGKDDVEGGAGGAAAEDNADGGEDGDGQATDDEGEGLGIASQPEAEAPSEARASNEGDGEATKGANGESVGAEVPSVDSAAKQSSDEARPAPEEDKTTVQPAVEPLKVEIPEAQETPTTAPPPAVSPAAKTETAAIASAATMSPRAASPGFERRSGTPASSLFARLASPPPGQAAQDPLSPLGGGGGPRLGSPPPSNPYADTATAASPSPSTPGAPHRQLASAAAAAAPASPSPAASPISPTSYAVRQPRVSLANRLRGVVTRQGSQEPEPAPTTPTKPAAATAAVTASTPPAAAVQSNGVAAPPAVEASAVSETAAPTPPPVEKDQPVTKDLSVEKEQQDTTAPPTLPEKELKPAEAQNVISEDRAMGERETGLAANNAPGDGNAAAEPETTATKLDETNESADTKSASA